LDDLRNTNREIGADMAIRIAEVKSGVLEALQLLKAEFIRQQEETNLIIRQEKADRNQKEQEEQSRKLADKHFISEASAPRPVPKPTPVLRTSLGNTEDVVNLVTTDVPSLTSKLFEKADSAMHIAADLGILSSLRFGAMEFRHSKIVEAHPNTFCSVFSDKLAPWLQGKDPIFWISGKAGSGKSTLMKYLIHDRKTELNLQTWSGSRRLVVASYFFWINGTVMQKSQQGLLQSILYDILRRFPNLIRLSFPHRWQSMTTGSSGFPFGLDFEPWTRLELLNAFRLITEHNINSTRFCLFIDGLDEYEGEHEELIQVVKDLAGTSNVKLCIASRPWNVFESAFGKTENLKVYLQSVNKPDIQLYVKNKLEDRADFIALRGRDLQADVLIEELIEKAQGVFLWVYLVVRSLIRGLQNSDRISDMQRRLRSFPDDLDALFSRMLMSLDPIYRTQAARAFQISLSACRPLSLLNYWYSDVEEENPNFALCMPVRDIRNDERRSRHEEIKKRLNGRCKGFLESTIEPGEEPQFQNRVDFLHRTVRDFLMTKDMQHMLSKWIATDLDADLVICKTSLAEIKSSTIYHRPLAHNGPISELVADFFHSARQYHQRTGICLTELLDELVATISAHAKRIQNAENSSPVDYPAQIEEYPWSSWGAQSFLTYAVQWNLEFAVKREVDRFEKTKKITRGEKGVFMDHAIYFQRDRFRFSLAPDPSMVEFLLRRGPSVPMAVTPFIDRLQRSAEWWHKPDSIFRTLKLMCQHGANLEQDPSSREVLLGILSDQDVGELFNTKTIQLGNRAPSTVPPKRSRNPFKWRWKSKRQPKNRPAI
jgi:hypothetical protein